MASPVDLGGHRTGGKQYKRGHLTDFSGSALQAKRQRHYNTIRPHTSIGYKPPAPEVFVPAFAAWPAALRRPAPPATLAQRPDLLPCFRTDLCWKIPV